MSIPDKSEMSGRYSAYLGTLVGAPESVKTMTATLVPTLTSVPTPTTVPTLTTVPTRTLTRTPSVRKVYLPAALKRFTRPYLPMQFKRAR